MHKNIQKLGPLPRITLYELENTNCGIVNYRGRFCRALFLSSYHNEEIENKTDTYTGKKYILNIKLGDIFELPPIFLPTMKNCVK